jgi:hypothetical protein
MSQIFHIFRKDVRHFWIEILLCQLALAAYCWNEVRSWSDVGVDPVSTFIHGLLLLTWCFFIFRMIQDESLVGDRQFWVTRPYAWKSLLAEKLLLVLVFLNLPIFVAGAILLAKAGFSPRPHVLGLLWMQLLLFELPFLPLLALSTVTRTVIQAFLTLLTLFVLAIGAAVSLLFGSAIGHVSGVFGVSWSPLILSNDLGDLLLVLVCLVAIGLQYSRRRTAQSRLWLVGGMLAMVAISLATSYARRNQDPYPHPERSTIQFNAALDPVKLTPPKRPVETDEAVPIGLPLSASGVPTNSLGAIRGIRLVLEAPDGHRWDGQWPGHIQILVPGDNRWRAMLEMDYENYQRLKSVPLKARVSVSVDIFREHGFETITTTAGEFAVPGVGRCHIMRLNQLTLRCNSPLVRPGMVVARFDQALSTCSAEDIRPPVIPAKPLEGLPYAWQPRRDSRLAEAGVSPVVGSFFSFWDFSGSVNICPGTPLDFSFPEFVENVRRDFEIDNFRLEDYRQADYSSEGIKNASGIKLGLPPLR